MEKTNVVNGRQDDQEVALSSEVKKSIEFFSKQYDKVLKKLDQKKVRIKEISNKSAEISEAINAIENGLTMLNNILTILTNLGNTTVVQACFHQPGTACSFFAVELQTYLASG